MATTTSYDLYPLEKYDWTFATDLAIPNRYVLGRYVKFGVNDKGQTVFQYIDPDTPHIELVFQKDANGRYIFDSKGFLIPVLNPDGTQKTQVEKFPDGTVVTNRTEMARTGDMLEISPDGRSLKSIVPPGYRTTSGYSNGTGWTLDGSGLGETLNFSGSSQYATTKATIPAMGLGNIPTDKGGNLYDTYTNYLGQFAQLAQGYNQRIKSYTVTDNGVLGDIANTIGKLGPLAPLALSYALPGIGTAIGTALGVGSAAGAAIGNMVLATALNGGDLAKGVQAGIASYAGAQMGGIAGDIAKGGDMGTFLQNNPAYLANIANSVTQAAINGQDVQTALAGSLLSAGVSAATSQIPGFKDFDPSVKNAITNGIAQSLQGKDVTVAGLLQSAALNGVTSYALSQIPDYDKLDKKYQTLATTSLSSALQGKDLTKNTINWALNQASQAVNTAVANDKAAEQGWTDAAQQQAAKAAGYTDPIAYSNYLNSKAADDAAVKAGWPDAATQKTALDIGITTPDAWTNYVNENKAKESGFPDYTTYQQYNGDSKQYKSDLIVQQNHQTIMDTFHNVLGRDPTPEEYQQFAGQNAINIKNTLDRQTLDEWKLAAGEGYNLGQGAATDRYGFTSEQKQNIADFLRSAAKYSDSGIRLDPDTGEYIVKDPTNDLTHKFSSDGSYLGNIPYISGSGAKEEIGDEANALLSSVSPIINAATAGKDVTGGTSSGDTSETDTGGTQTTPMGDISSSEADNLKKIGALLGLGDPNPESIKQTLLGGGATSAIDEGFSLIGVNGPDRELVLEFIIPELQRTDLSESERETLQKIADKVKTSLDETKQQETTDTAKTDTTKTDTAGGSEAGGGGGDTEGGDTGGGQTEPVTPTDDTSARSAGWSDYAEYQQANIAGYNNPTEYRAVISAAGNQTGTSGAGGAGTAISGVSGYSGVSGVSGVSGYSEVSGYSGVSGISGYSGVSGISGYSGVSGESGVSGYSGISGYSGTSGISGYSGVSGVSGYSGISGKSGFSGLRGLQGVPGVDVNVGTFGSQFGSFGAGAASTPAAKLEHQLLTSKQTPYQFVSPLAAVLALSKMGGSEENQATQGALEMQTPHYSYGNISSIDEILGMPEYFSGLNQPAEEEQAAHGGLMSSPLMAASGGFAGTTHGRYAGGGLPQGVIHHSGKARVDFRHGDAVTGAGDGQSDDIPAMLADGEFVFPADVVAAIGNGSTKAGSDKLYDMMHSIRAHVRSAKPKDLPPEIKSPLDFLGKKYRKG